MVFTACVGLPTWVTHNKCSRDVRYNRADGLGREVGSRQGEHGLCVVHAARLFKPEAISNVEERTARGEHPECE